MLRLTVTAYPDGDIELTGALAITADVSSSEITPPSRSLSTNTLKLIFRASLIEGSAHKVELSRV